MKLRATIKTFYLKRLRATAAWLNDDIWNGSLYHLPDGQLFPQAESNEFREEVARWVTGLIEARWNLALWKRKDSAAWDRLNRGLGLYRPSLVLTSSSTPEYWFEPADPRNPVLPSHWFMFADLLMNAERERLGRCDRCRRFYVSAGYYRNKRYCSRSCGRNAAVSRYVMKRKREGRARKIELAQKLLVRWRPQKGDWKRWLVRRAHGSKSKLTLTFVTRAANKGDIVPPRGNVSTKEEHNR